MEYVAVNARFKLAVVWLLCTASGAAQVRSTSPPKPFGPALVVEAELHTEGSSRPLEAGERVRMRALVSNRGSAARR